MSEEVRNLFPKDMKYIDALPIVNYIEQLQQEKQQLKERVAYLERSNDRKEETIIDLRMEQELDLYKSVLNEVIEYIKYALDEEKETPSKYNDWRLDLLEILERGKEC